MLDLNHVSMTFNPGTVNEKKALTDINLHMESGEFATIVGSNGAGKSTLFNAIAGSFIPDTGSILLDGVDMTFQPDFRRSKAIGRLFQDPLKGTAPNMTIEENLALAYLRASTHTSPFSRITKADRELFTDRLVQLGLGTTRRKFGWRQNWITMKSTVFRFQPCPDMQENLFLDGSDPFRWCA